MPIKLKHFTKIEHQAQHGEKLSRTHTAAKVAWQYSQHQMSYAKTQPELMKCAFQPFLKTSKVNTANSEHTSASQNGRQQDTECSICSHFESAAARVSSAPWLLPVLSTPEVAGREGGTEGRDAAGRDESGNIGSHIPSPGISQPPLPFSSLQMCTRFRVGASTKS